MNHRFLISDLERLIAEVKAEKFEPNNIGDYLKFWLLNHIRNFDIPAFESKTGSC